MARTEFRPAWQRMPGEMQENQGFPTPTLYHKHPKKCTIFSARTRSRPFFQMPNRPFSAPPCPFSAVFAPSPLVFPHKTACNVVKSNPRYKVILDTCGQIGIEWRKRYAKSPRTAIRELIAEVIVWHHDHQWRRVRDLNPSYAINVNTISSRAYWKRAKRCSIRLSGLLHLDSLIPTPTPPTPRAPDGAHSRLLRCDRRRDSRSVRKCCAP